MNKIDTLRKIVETNKSVKFNSITIEPYQAANILEIYDTIDKSAQKVYESMNYREMLEVANQLFN